MFSLWSLAPCTSRSRDRLRNLALVMEEAEMEKGCVGQPGRGPVHHTTGFHGIVIGCDTTASKICYCGYAFQASEHSEEIPCERSS